MHRLSYAAPAGRRDGWFDAAGRPREPYGPLAAHVRTLGLEGLRALQQSAEMALHNQGATFGTRVATSTTASRGRTPCP